MQIKFNGKALEVASESLSDLLRSKNLEPQMVSVELNEQPIDSDHFAQTRLKEGDEVEVLMFMGGGR